MSHFNYVITIHNKQELIERVLWGVLLCAGPNSKIYAVLDGCTDDTEKLIDQITDRFAGIPITKVYTNNVHELLSINAGLRAAAKDGRQMGSGYNIILQDDVILADRDLERKVDELYAWGSYRIGYVSFRLGVNFGPEAATFGPAIQQIEEIESAYGAAITGSIVLPGRFACRTIPIKSPVCLPTRIVDEVGMFAEDLAPYAYDDYDLAIRTTAAGYQNGVFGVRFYSDVRWGSSRKPGHPDIMIMVRRNGAIIRGRFQAELAQICSRPQSTAIHSVIATSEEDDAHALRTFERSKERLPNYSSRPVEWSEWP